VEPLPELNAQQIADEVSNEEDFRIQISELEEQLSRMKPNLAAIAEYRKKVIIPSCSNSDLIVFASDKHMISSYSLIFSCPLFL